MGSCSVTHRVPEHIKTPSELREYWGGYIDEQRREFGTDPYSGSMATLNGLQIENKEFAGQQPALDWILEKTYKRGPAIAVRVKMVQIDHRLVDADPKVTELYEASRKAQDEARRVAGAVLDGMQQGPKFRSCSCCGAKIPMSYQGAEGQLVKVRVSECPVCRTGSLLKKGEKAAIQKARTAADKAGAKVTARRQEVQAKLESKATPVEFWLAAGWAAE